MGFRCQIQHCMNNALTEVIDLPVGDFDANLWVCEEHYNIIYGLTTGENK